MRGSSARGAEVYGEISAVAASIRVALDLAKGVKTAADALGDAEMKFKLAELYAALADAKMAIADAETSVAEKDAEIERLKREFQRLGDDTVIAGPYRFRKGKDGQPIGRPFCPRCLEVDGRLILTERA